MQAKIIVDDQLSGSAQKKQDGRLYFIRSEASPRAAYRYAPNDGRLTISVRFNCLMNITGISVQGKGMEPTQKVEFTTLYDVDVNYDNEEEKIYSLGKVSRKYFFPFLWLHFSTKLNSFKATID